MYKIAAAALLALVFIGVAFHSHSEAVHTQSG